MKETSFYKWVVSSVVVLLSIVAMLNYRVDPFFVYHEPYYEPYLYGQMYQNLGMAKHFKYDTLITGTSMTEGFVSSWFSNKFNCDALKLPFAGGNMKDFTNLFNVALNSENEIKNVFFGLDIYTLCIDPESTRFEYENYQLTNNPIDHMEYLLSNEILMKYGYQMVNRSKVGQKFDRDNMYIWESQSVYGKEVVLENYARPEKNKVDNIKIFKLEKQNFDININSLISIIKAHEDVEFTIFFPPYSILYWDYMSRLEQDGFRVEILKEATKQLLDCHNVEMYGFITNTDIITNLDNYKDYTHYKQDINKYMLDCFGTEDNLLTKDNYVKDFEEFEGFISNYDFESIFK